MSDTPRTGDVHALWQADTLGKIRVGGPAVVVSYNPTTLRAVVQMASPLLRDDPDVDALVPVPVPPLDLPVCFPGGGAYSITWPLVAGTAGFVIFADRETDAFRASRAVGAPPTSARRFDLVDGHFIPCTVGAGPPNANVAAAAAFAGIVIRGPSVMLGGIAAVPLATAPLVTSEIERLYALLLTVAAAVPVILPPTFGANVAATKAKGE